MNPEFITPELAQSLLPERPANAHKGTFGHLFIVGGSRGYSGAPVLAAMGALRSGVGLVTVGIPESLGEMPDKGLPEAMTFPLPETREQTMSMVALEEAYEFSANMDAVTLGPGMSQHSKTREFILSFIAECPAPLIIDADGLNALQGATDTLEKRPAPTMLTPHPGEMARLRDCSASDVQKNRNEIAQQCAADWNCTIVLKGHETVVADPQGSIHLNTTGNPGMATGGSGDVLSGLLGGLAAQGLSMRNAAMLGVYLHGLAGDIAADALSQRGMTATDIASMLPHAWQLLEERY